MQIHLLIRSERFLSLWISFLHICLFLQLITQVVNASNETILLEDEEFVLVVDLFIVRPELHLEVTGLDQAFLFPPPHLQSDLLKLR